MSTYSFQDYHVTIIGPGGSIDLGAGSGMAEEGATIETTQDKNVMTIGADGAVQHSLVADNGGILTLRFLKTSEVNNKLSLMYNLQTASAATHGINTITMRDSARGDFITCTLVAFKKRPDLNYAKEAGLNEWVFDAGVVIQLLGPGTPEA